MQINLPKPNSKLANLCIKHMDNPLNLALIALKFVDEFRYKPLPNKPEIFESWEMYTETEEYVRRPIEKRSKKILDLMKNKEFYAYNKSTDSITKENLSNRAYLEQMMELFAEAGKTEEMEKTNKVLNPFLEVAEKKPYKEVQW